MTNTGGGVLLTLRTTITQRGLGKSKQTYKQARLETLTRSPVAQGTYSITRGPWRVCEVHVVMMMSL